MKRSIKITVRTLVVLATILIITGLSLTLKELMDAEEQLNVGDDTGYYKAILNLNGATSVDSKVLKCKIVDDKCTVVLPQAYKDNGVILGFSDNAKDTVAKYKMGDTITLDSSIELFTISYKTYTLKIANNEVDYLEKSEVSCNVFNNNKECSVTLPSFNKVGYENKGYSTSIESIVGFKYPKDEYILSKDAIIYPIYSTSARNKSLSIADTFTYQDSFIEVEKGCSETVYKKFLKYLDGIKEHVPFLLLGNKITFVCDNSFNSIWGDGYVGMNYGPKSLRSVDIRCSDNSFNDYYATMVHEMAHSWDFYYATKLGDNISSQADVINLYNKYKDNPNRPFRDYSYSNIYEFLADMMRYYYFKYYEPNLVA